MLSVTDKMGPFVAPQVDANPAFEEAKKQRTSGGEKFNFDKVIGESNTAIAEQMEADKKALGEAGELKIGESKNDKEFREMLERVSGRKQDKLKNKLDKDDYLNLMVTQLKYQDPTKPMENHEMATQLAQFNTVEQLINVNKSLTDMSNQAAQANVDKLTPYLGKLVEVNGAKLKVGMDQKATQGSLELPAAAGSVSVMIKDGTGTVVRTLGLGEKDMGRHAIEWDGKTDGGIAAKPGNYTFEVAASTLDGKEMKVKTSFVAKVEAITDLASGGKLETASGAVEAKDILAIRPDNSTAAPVAAQANPLPLTNNAPAKPAAASTNPASALTPDPTKPKREVPKKAERAESRDDANKPQPAKAGVDEKQAVNTAPVKNAETQKETKVDAKKETQTATSPVNKTEPKKAI